MFVARPQINPPILHAENSNKRILSNKRKRRLSIDSESDHTEAKLRSGTGTNTDAGRVSEPPPKRSRVAATQRSTDVSPPRTPAGPAATATAVPVPNTPAPTPTPAAAPVHDRTVWAASRCRKHNAAYAAAAKSTCERIQRKLNATQMQHIQLPMWKKMQRRGMIGSAHTHAQGGGANEGDARFDAIMRDLDLFSKNGKLIVRNRTQREFNRHMMNAGIPLIYGADFDASVERILAANRWKEIRQEVFIITSRRAGKTLSTAMFAAAMLLNCPEIMIVVFAPCLRTGGLMVGLIKRLLMSHPKGQSRIMQRFCSATCVKITGPNGAASGDVRMVTALPSKSDNTRGFEANLILIDECWYVNEKLMTETILPATQEGRLCMVGISTPQGSDSYFTVMIRKMDMSVDPPQPMWNVIRTGICEECRIAKTVLKCTHMEPAHWLSQKKIGKLKQVLADKPHLLQREMFGEPADADIPAFNHEHIDNMINNVPHGMQICNKPVTCVYLAVDPSGAGSSNFAFVGIVQKGTRMELCLLAITNESEGLEDDELLVSQIITAIREMYPKCVIVFIPESNLGKEGSHLERLVRHDNLICTMSHKPGWFGMQKTAIVTFEMHAMMEHVLRDKAMFISDTLWAIPPPSAQRNLNIVPGSRAAAMYMLNVLRTEGKAMRWQDLTKGDPMNQTEKTAYKLSGKRGSAMNDDLWVALMTAWYWKGQFWDSSEPRYVDARRLMGPCR